MTDVERDKLLGLLSDPYYAESKLKERFLSGDLKIEIGPSNWPDGWYKDPYWNRSIPIVLLLAFTLPTANNFHVSYSRETDFHHVRFDFDNETFVVEWYKIYTLHRKSDRKRMYFDFAEKYYNLGNWIKRGEHRTSPHWREASSISDPFKEDKSNV